MLQKIFASAHIGKTCYDGREACVRIINAGRLFLLYGNFLWNNREDTIEKIIKKKQESLICIACHVNYGNKQWCADNGAGEKRKNTGSCEKQHRKQKRDFNVL